MNREKVTALHSRYNPKGEAERYIDALTLSEKIRFFILIEPGLGYMVAPLRKKVPGAKVIALHAEKPACPPVDPPDSQWYPETGVSVQDFLEAEIPDSQALELRLLEWRPALAVYGRRYLALVEEAAAFIRRSDANVRTTIAFGPRWFKNFFRNLDILKNVICPVPEGKSDPGGSRREVPEHNFPVSLPLLVTGAGPGLEEVIPIIKKEPLRHCLYILAAASSQEALKAKDLAPDLMISTDGSNWARFHLFDFLRGVEDRETCPLAATLTAALPSQCENLPVLPISDGSLWQTVILNELKIPYITLPQRGTVTATAIDLAFSLTKEEILIAGMDLANKGIRSHARPYSFNRFMEEKERRTNPVYSQTYMRSSLLKTGGSYSIYAAWFEKQLSLYPRPIHTLGINNPVFGSLESANHVLTERGKKEAANFKTISLGFSERQSQKACAILENAMEDPSHGEAIRKELLQLLLPGEKNASVNDLKDAIRSLAGYRTKNGR